MATFNDKYFFIKKVKTQQQNKKASIKNHARAENSTRYLVTLTLLVKRYRHSIFNAKEITDQVRRTVWDKQLLVHV